MKGFFRDNNLRCPLKIWNAKNHGQENLLRFRVWSHSDGLQDFFEFLKVKRKHIYVTSKWRVRTVEFKGSTKNLNQICFFQADAKGGL